MKIFISADIEGVTGVTDWNATISGEKGYDEACAQMTAEVAAACRACQSLGYEVVVKDGHGDALNLDINKLPKGVQLIRGWLSDPLSMMSGLDDTFDGVIYIGYHSGAGTDTSPLKHTGEDYLFNWMKVNGRPASEFTLNASLADYMGVPSLLITGDLGICEAAQNEYPGIETVVTKEGIGNGTWNKHPEDVLEEIEEKVKAVLSKDLPHPRKVEDEYTVEINFKDFQRAKRGAWYPSVERIDPFTIKYTAKDPLELAVMRMFTAE